jgi:hypothetical protein
VLATKNREPFWANLEDPVLHNVIVVEDPQKPSCFLLLDSFAYQLSDSSKLRHNLINWEQRKSHVAPANDCNIFIIGVIAPKAIF